jgi:hypothetical protein
MNARHLMEEMEEEKQYCKSKFCSDPLIKCVISEYHALLHLETVEEQVTRMWYTDYSLLKMVLQVSKHCEIKFNRYRLW